MTPCDAIAGQLGALFICSPHGQYVKVRTPFLYPDGDVVDLFIRDEGARVVVSDLGESLRWLTNQTLALRRPPKQRQLIDDIKLTNDVEIVKGMLVVRALSEGLADAVMRIGQAAVRVGDLWFTMQSRAVQSVTDDVAEFLTEQSFIFERRAKAIGRSMKAWTVDFRVNAEAPSYVHVLSTENRGAAQVSMKAAVAMWHDLSNTLNQPKRFISLVDDNIPGVWSDEDFRLLTDVSTVELWAKPDDFAAALRAPESTFIMS